MGEVRRGCWICRTEPEECSGCQIERLEAENARLRKALDEIRNVVPPVRVGDAGLMRDIAQKALEG